MTENRIRLSKKQQLYKGCPLNKNSQGYLKIPCFIIDIIQGKELRNMNNVSITPYEQIQKLRAIDDIMFQMLAESEKVCQEILRVILDDAKLIVQKVTPQASIANILGRSVRLDALCTLGDGTICNIEVQKKNDNDDLRRVRYNASSIVSNFQKKAVSFLRYQMLQWFTFLSTMFSIVAGQYIMLIPLYGRQILLLMTG